METLTKPTKEQIITLYRQSLDRAMSGFGQLDDREWNKKANDWTAREHLAGFLVTTRKETLHLTRQALAGEPCRVEGFDHRSQTRAFRQACMMEARDLPVPELLDQARAAVEEHIAMLEGATEADLDRPAMSPTWDREATVRDLFFAAYLFLAGLYQDVRRVNKKKLPHWVEAGTPEQVNYHMGRIFHYMPLIFRSDRGADVKATYLFTMEGPGGGQWHLRISDGRAEAGDGPVAERDIEIKTKPQHWVDLSTGELNPVTAIMPGPFQKVALSGTISLAMKLSDLFTAEE